MGQHGNLSAGTDTKFDSYADLIATVRNDSWSVTATKEYRLKIYRWKSLIYTSKPILWTENGLKQAVDLVSLLFRDVPRGLSFVVSVFWIHKGRGIQTQTVISSKVNTSLKKAKGGVRLRIKLLPASFSAISSSNSGKRNRMIRKNQPVSSRRGVLRYKSLPPNPIERKVDYLTRTYTTINPVGTTVAKTYVSYHREYSSQRTAGFKSKSRKGILPVNPYSMYVARADGGNFSRHEVLPPPPVNSGNFSHTDSNVMDYVSLADVNLAHLPIDENRVIAKLSGRINAADVNIPEDLIQAHQTLSLFTSNTRRLAAAGKLLKTGNLSEALRITGAQGSKSIYKTYSALRRNGIYGSRLLAQMWLELRYGWIPLIQDIEGSVKAWSQFLSRDPDICSVSSSVKGIKDDNIPVVGFTLNGTGSGMSYTHEETICRIGLTYKLDSRVLSLFSQLGFTSPVALAWELIPFSFVVDWFLPIGNALQAYHTFEGLAFKKGYKTYFSKTHRVFDLGYSGPDGVYQTCVTSGRAYLESVRMNRSVLNDFPKPNFPKVKNPLSVIHAANAAALLVHVFTSK